MSKESYRRNLAVGAANPELPVCFLSACEQISPDDEFEPDFYNFWMEKIDAIEQLPIRRRNAQFVSAYDDLANQCGLRSAEDIYCKTFKSYHQESFTKGIRNILAKGCRVVVDIQVPGVTSLHGNTPVSHAVGVERQGYSRYQLFSSWLPSGLEEPISASVLFGNIYHNWRSKYSSRYPFNTANVTILPPSKRSTKIF